MHGGLQRQQERLGQPAQGAPPPFQTLLTQGEASESKAQQDAEAQNGTEGSAADARQDIELACANDNITPGGQGHGFPQ